MQDKLKLLTNNRNHILSMITSVARHIHVQEKRFLHQMIDVSYKKLQEIYSGELQVLTFIVAWYCIVSLLVKANVPQMKNSSNNLQHTALVFICYSYHIHCFLKRGRRKRFTNNSTNICRTIISCCSVRILALFNNSIEKNRLTPETTTESVHL